MKQLGLQAFTDTYLTAMGLVIFFLFFIGVLLWVYRRNSKSLYKHLSQFPLKDEK